MVTDAIAEGTAPDILLPAMDENLWRFWRDYGRVSGAELHEAPDLRWFASGIPLSVFNGVPYARLSENGVRPALALIQAIVDRRGVPAMWWVGPNTLPIDLAAHLELRGLAMTRIMIGMAVELDAIQYIPKVPTDFHIEEVRGVEMQSLWARVLAKGNAFPDDAARMFADLEPTLSGTDCAGSPRYLGFLSGRPAATSVLVLAAGLAGIYAVSTLPDARRQGLGAAMTVLPLFRARSQGYRLGILQATVMGHSVYKGLGFRDVSQYRCYSQVPSPTGT